MSGYIYILQDDNKKFYIGSTDNLQKRLHQHALGHTQTTRNMKNPKIAFSQKFESLQLARKIELRLKRLKRRDYIEKIVKDGYIKMK